MTIEGKASWQQEANAQKYTHPVDMQLLNDKPIFDLLGNLSGKEVLDIGCGSGIIARQIATLADEVFGIDYSLAMIKEAVSRNNQPNLHYQFACADNLPFASQSFDAAICSLVICSYPSETLVANSFKEAARVLKPDTLYVISVPHPTYTFLPRRP